MFGRKKGEGEPRPPEAVEADIQEIDENLNELLSWLREAGDQGNIDAAIDLMREQGEKRLALMEERKALLAVAQRLEQEGDPEGAAEVADAVADADAALQDSVEAQMRAKDALDKAKDIAESEPLSEEEIAAGKSLSEDVTADMPGLSESDKTAATRRAARLLRQNDREIARGILAKELSQVKIKPKAWTDISWHTI